VHVIVHANRRTERATELVGELLAGGLSAEMTSFDLVDADATVRGVALLLEEGAIQVLVNNAGIHDDAPLAGMSAAQWHSVIDVTLGGFYNVTQPLMLPMIGTRWGRIINISSVAAVLGNRGQSNYAAAKAGLHGATKSLALELASRGITVNTVAPGVIAGAMTEQVFNAETIKSIVPMRRAGTPDEVAALVGFLASEEAGYISGQIISINGAMG
jgi:3-oxoacyl-[acyl-carrier protein] reductase